MAVPKKKTSKSKRNMRRSHHALKKVNIVVDATTGEYKLPHHISLADGYYAGRQVLAQKVEPIED
jgi:large subunit ribosomal protein L32